MKGKKLEKLLASVAAINDSLEAGGWLKGLARSANSGFYQGSGIRVDEAGESYKNKALSELKFSLHYGHPVKDVEAALKEVKVEELKKQSLEFVRAWMMLCNQKDLAIKELDSSRPLPVITKVGLSPKVTKTLTEMNLDIDLSSIEMAEVDFELVDKLDKDGNVVYDKKTGKVLKEKYYFVKWSEGVRLGQSRFYAGFSECEACGKNIPSKRFVPIEAVDKKSKSKVGLWLGCDCAKNIFGVKDLGINRT